MDADKRENPHNQAPLAADLLSVLEQLPPQGLTAPCIDTFHAYHHSGTRAPASVKWIVMHDTEGGTALAIARYFEAPSSGGSAHLVIDDRSCYRCLNDNQIPWGAPGSNTQGFHIEQCGYARWTSLIWNSQHRQLLERAAYKAALHCRKFNIPPYFVSAAGLRAGQRGVTTHAECTKAFGGSHTDPGAGWPRWWFMRRVRYHYKRLWHIHPY